MKKILAITLAIVMMLSLGACGKFESQMANAMTNLKDADSFSVDMAVNIKANMKVEDTDVPLIAACKAKADVFSKPYRSHINMDISVSGESMGDEEFYFARGDNEVIVYLRDELEDWAAISTELEDVTMPTFSVDQLLALAKITETFDETEESKKADNGKATYSGVITGEDVQKFIEIMSMESVSEKMMDTAVDGVVFDLSKLGNIPTTIVIDEETNTFSQFVFDLSEWVTSAVTIASDFTAVDPDAEEMDAGLSIAAASLVVNIKNYNNAPAFEIPQVSIPDVLAVNDDVSDEPEIDEGAGDEEVKVDNANDGSTADVTAGVEKTQGLIDNVVTEGVEADEAVEIVIDRVPLPVA